MQILQVSATTLDAFRRHLSEDGIPGIATDADFVRAIISPVRETEAMRNGTMIHSILEDPHRWVFKMGGRDWYGTPDCCISESTLAQMQTYVQPVGAFEVPAWKAYQVWPTTAMVVTMRLDQVYADEVTDIKTVWSDRDDDWYYESKWAEREQSLQWRLYLDAVPGLTQARYIQLWMTRGLPEATLRHVDVITLPRTQGLSDELEGWCRELFAFANRHRELLNYLRERGARKLDTYTLI